ncbi:hypothetical protein PR048_008251 [Dryococelus australis]|uniref:Uncharacterized protein n=1 Tax=Dryococelus australis TaxID=614101 RepID=A0ABQ9HXF0_9NEOP|nr:hypothetical protein PR048_008251 [Dryococelus australis]
MAPGIVILEVTRVHYVKTPQCWEHFTYPECYNRPLSSCYHGQTPAVLRRRPNRAQTIAALDCNGGGNGFVWHDSHLRKFCVDPAGNQVQFAWWKVTTINSYPSHGPELCSSMFLKRAGSLKPTKFIAPQSARNITLTAFFDIQEPILLEFKDLNDTISAQRYTKIPNLHKAVIKMQHDSGRLHVGRVVDALANNKLEARIGKRATDNAGTNVLARHQAGAGCARSYLSPRRPNTTHWIACSPPTKAIRAQFPAGSLRIFACDNRADDAIGRRVFSMISLSSPPSFRGCSILTSITHIGSQDLDPAMIYAEGHRSANVSRRGLQREGTLCHNVPQMTWAHPFQPPFCGQSRDTQHMAMRVFRERFISAVPVIHNVQCLVRGLDHVTVECHRSVRFVAARGEPHTKVHATTRDWRKGGVIVCMMHDTSRYDTASRTVGTAQALVTHVSRVQFPAGRLPDLRMWESYQTMPLVGGFSSVFSRFPHPYIPALPHTLLVSPPIGSQDIDRAGTEPHCWAFSCPLLSTHCGPLRNPIITRVQSKLPLAVEGVGRPSPRPTDQQQGVPLMHVIGSTVAVCEDNLCSSDARNPGGFAASTTNA